MIVEAQRAERAAEKSTAKAGGALGRAVHLRTIQVVTVTDYIALTNYLWARRPEEMRQALAALARAEANVGVSNIPGVEITEEKKVA